MAHRRHRRTSVHPVGLAPGSLAQPAGSAVAVPIIEMFAWGTGDLIEKRVASIAEIAQQRGTQKFLWVNFDGTPSGETLAELGRNFGLHLLALEDVLRPTPRAKVEPFDTVLFVVAPIPLLQDNSVLMAGSFETEQLALFLGPDFVITIQERPGGDCLDGVRQRLRSREGRQQRKGAAYLAFSIFDSVIDYYFPLVNALSNRVDKIEGEVVDSRSVPDMYAIRELKHELARVRQAIWPMRDALTGLMTMESFFDMENRIFLRSALDHVMRLIDMLESDRACAGDLMELSIALANAKLGEVTKVLTMIATIFIPITFIASIYGMNFEHMPELQWALGYPMALGLMAATVLGFGIMFWRRGWFESAMKPPSRR